MMTYSVYCTFIMNAFVIAAMPMIARGSGPVSSEAKGFWRCQPGTRPGRCAHLRSAQLLRAGRGQRRYRRLPLRRISQAARSDERGGDRDHYGGRCDWACWAKDGPSGIRRGAAGRSDRRECAFGQVPQVGAGDNHSTIRATTLRTRRAVIVSETQAAWVRGRNVRPTPELCVV